MENKKARTVTAAQLRLQAEKILLEKESALPENLEAISPEEIQRVLHELRVHQIELEMQNEELGRTQVDLDTARAHYFDLYDLAPVGYCTISEHGLILQVNLTTAALLGVTRGSLIKKRISQFILKEDQDIFYHLHRQVTKTSEEQTCELRMVKNDGTQFWALLETTATLEEGYENRENRDAGDRRENSRTVIRVVIVDISERKRTEQSLLESEYKYRNLFNTLSEGFALNEMIFDEKGEMIDYRILEVNPAFYTTADYMGSVVGNVATKVYGMSPEFINAFWREHKSRNTVQIVEMRSPITDRTFIVSTSPFLNDQFVTSFFDITERKQAEEALQNSETRLREILENSLDASYKRDLKTNSYDYMSPVFDRITGYGSEEMKNLPIETVLGLIHPDEQPEIERVIAESMLRPDPRPYQVDYRFKHKDGQYRWFHDQFIVTRDSLGQPVARIGSVSDITDRKQIELALLASEAKLRTVLNNSHDAIGVHVNGTWTMCNPAALELFGVASEQELIGTAIVNVIAPAERARIREYVRSRIQGNDAPSAYLTRGLRSDGSEFDLEVTLSTFTQLGELNVLVILRDITERKLNEDLLRESEQRFRHLSDAVPALVWQSGTNGLCDYFNKRWLEFTGRTLEQEMGNGWSEGVHPDDHQKFLDIYLGAIEKREIFSMEYRLRRFDGEYRWLLDTGVPRFTQGGIFLGYLGSCVDIGDIKQLEAELHTQRDFATTIINTMGQGLTVVDADGRFEFVNPAYADLFGYKAEDLIGRHPRDLTVLESQAMLDEQREQRLSGKTSTYESNLMRADGSVAPVLITGVPRMPVGSEKYSGSISVITDLTEQKRTENELRTAKEALEKALVREQELSQTDGLTGINNRRYLFELAERKLAVAARYEQSLAVIMFDIDHFKQVNDVFGHGIGDKILKHVVQTVCAELRTADVIGRYGGEEFIILLPMTNAQQAYPLAERIRTSVAGTGVPSETGNVSVTLSVGIVEMNHSPQAETVEDLFRRADNAMYSAKFTGRDRTVIGQK